MTNVDALRDGLDCCLAQHFEVVARVSHDRWSLRNGSARVFVTLQEVKGRPLVQVRSPLVRGAAATSELFEHVATESDDYVFGHLSCTRHGESADVFLSHVLQADDLQPIELVSCVRGMLATANEIDGDLARRFGGTPFHSDQE